MKNSQWMRAVNTVFIVGTIYALAGTVLWAASNGDDSIGAKTGEAARGLKNTAEETYQATSQKAVETTARVAPILEDALQAVKAQMQVASKSINDSLQNLNQALQRELQKFNEAYHQPQK